MEKTGEKRDGEKFSTFSPMRFVQVPFIHGKYLVGMYSWEFWGPSRSSFDARLSFFHGKKYAGDSLSLCNASCILSVLEGHAPEGCSAWYHSRSWKGKVDSFGA